MTTLRTEALVLRSVDVGESDRILHLLTPATARLTVVAKGARRSRRRFPGTLDLFNHLRVQVERRKPTVLARLDHARLLAPLPGLRADPTRFAMGCYLLEMLDRLAPESGSTAEGARLFAFALDALRVVEAEAPDARLRTLLELRALDALGLRPELGRCVRCGARSEAAAAPRGEVGFSVADGGPLCVRCAAPDEALLPVHVGTLRTLERSLAFPPARLGRIALGGAALAEAARLMSRFLRFHVGVELRSEGFLDERLTLRKAEGKLRPPGTTNP